jgi:hypothetical protein
MVLASTPAQAVTSVAAAVPEAVTTIAAAAIGLNRRRRDQGTQYAGVQQRC